MLVVVAYHLGHLRGGFLGVDVFFVLSGFLVTSLLLAEVEAAGGHRPDGSVDAGPDAGRAPGRIDLVAFWRARFRRLVPAVLVLVPTVLVAARVLRWPANRLDDLALDGTATATWWGNWRQIASGQSYWDPSPSPFRHAWSLAIEEQFYVVWPLVVVAIVSLVARAGSARAATGRVSPRLLIGVVAGWGALASAVLHLRMAGQVDEADLSRVYLGSDTRVFAILVGCALATTRWGLLRSADTGTIRSTGVLDAAAAVAAATLVAMTVSMEVDDPMLFRRGGFVVAALAAAILTVSVSTRGSSPLRSAGERLGPIGRGAGGLFSYLGVRSYGIYLWSWPVQVLVVHRWPDMATPIRSLSVVAVSLLVAEASYRLIEHPIRRGTGWASESRRRTPAWAFGVAVPIVAVLITVRASTPDPVHERLETEDAIELARSQPTRPPDHDAAPGGSSASDGLDVLVIGDSVAFTVGYYKPGLGEEPDGIAWIDSRSVIGCGLLAATGWHYPREGGGFGPPAGGDCVVQAEVEALGIAEDPDVVVILPGAWEVFEVRSPEGEVVAPMTDRMREVQSEEIGRRARLANEAGATFVVIGWACPGAGTPAERRDPRFIEWFDEVMRGSVDAAVRDHDADARYVAPGGDACDGGITGEPTDAKRGWMGDSNHVPGQEAGESLWHEWLGPLLVAEMGPDR